MDVRLLIVAYLMICVLPVFSAPYRSRSRNKNFSPKYDQKQTGEYNIQLHLKDFEIVALLSDSAFGELGDYDYNYDYAELTVKPGILASTTTKKPISKPPESSSTTPQPSITQSSSSSTSQQPTQSTTKIPSSASEKDVSQISNLSTTISPTEKVISLQILTTPSTAPVENDLDSNVTKEEALKQSTVKAEIVVNPAENSGLEKDHEENMPLVVHRKCASGFTRDKLGRCRRVRRPQPQFSFGISRLASLASKLRQGSNDSQTTDEEDSREE